MKHAYLNYNTNTYWTLCLVFCLAAGMLFLPDFSFATTTTTDDGISSVLCKVVKQLTGPIGKGISTIAIVVLGIGLFLGKLSWGLAIATAVGIGMIFSAGKVVTWLSGDGANNCA